MSATVAAASAPAGARPPARLPFATKLAIFIRLFAIQGSWNYELLLGNGIGFCLEPALRRLPGGRGGDAYRSAVARESRYFNAHPYLAAVAVGALARAELELEPPERIDRFRTALCGPLGSVGDRLVWAGWLPFCSLAALALFGLGASPVMVVAAFVGVYNVGHIGLRIWGFRVGWTNGLRVAGSLANPVLRHGPVTIGRLAAVATGIALPLAMGRVIGQGRELLWIVMAAVVFGAVFIVRAPHRIEGWRLALGFLALFALFSVIR